MRRTEAHQGVRMIKFVDVLGRYEASELGQLEAAELLGVGERTFRRWCQRYEDDGEAGLLDRRLLLKSGIVFAGAMTTGIGGSIASAAAEPLAVEPWSKTIGVPPPPYATPSPRALRMCNGCTSGFAAGGSLVITQTPKD